MYVNIYKNVFSDFSAIVFSTKLHHNVLVFESSRIGIITVYLQVHMLHLNLPSWVQSGNILSTFLFLNNEKQNTRQHVSGTSIKEINKRISSYFKTCKKHAASLNNTQKKQKKKQPSTGFVIESTYLWNWEKMKPV